MGLLGFISAGCTVMETGLVADPANSEGSIHNFICPLILLEPFGLPRWVLKTGGFGGPSNGISLLISRGFNVRE